MFITQGGLQSTDEAITAGVPLIAFPMFGDQWYNAEKYEYHGIGIKLDMRSLSEVTLQKSIELIAKNTTYRENMEKLRSLMRDEPQSPLERAVWWTEYVIRHGGAKHLRSAGANVSWTDYLMLDVVAVILGAVIILLVLIVALGLAVRRLLGSREKLKAD